MTLSLNRNNHRFVYVVIIVITALLASILSITTAHAQQNRNYQYVCEDSGSGLSAVDVLRKSGEHARFIALLNQYDPEAIEILSDATLSDKTLWAPTDTAFQQIEGQLSTMSPEEVKAVLGYHISPPQSRPNGDYDIITPDYLISNNPETFRTRTGVLTGSDQRITSTYENNTLLIETIEILPTAWCTQAGSIFSINQVLLSVEPPSALTKLWNSLVRTLLYDDIRFVIYSTIGAIAFGSIIAAIVTRIGRKTP